MNTKKDVLIAEDDAVLREVYIKKFSLAGYEIRVAENGEQALAAIEEKKPEALILDINMPVMDGFSVLESLPKDQRDFPIVLLTNLGDDQTRERGTELGADDFFVKNEMTIKTLLEMVESLLK